MWHGSDTASAIFHRALQVWDGECDGHGVRVQARINTVGGVVRDNLYDPDGCNGEGGYRNWGPDRVMAIRVCEVGVGCSSWRSAS